MPFRWVRDRIRYEDFAGQPFVPADPDLHHRNETLAGVGDPQLGVQWGGRFAPWSLAARAGASLPLGKTEENPFALGRGGLRHQHVQFGTGTSDPYAGLGGGRAFGGVGLQGDLFARWSLARNEHGYRAGDRYSASLTATRELVRELRASVGVQLAHESSETWDGIQEEEGNLGRTDLMLAMGLGRVVPPAGAFDLRVQFALAQRSHGEQFRIPLVLSLQWAK